MSERACNAHAGRSSPRRGRWAAAPCVRAPPAPSRHPRRAARTPPPPPPAPPARGRSNRGEGRAPQRRRPQRAAQQAGAGRAAACDRAAGHCGGGALWLHRMPCGGGGAWRQRAHLPRTSRACPAAPPLSLPARSYSLWGASVVPRDSAPLETRCVTSHARRALVPSTLPWRSATKWLSIGGRTGNSGGTRAGAVPQGRCACACACQTQSDTHIRARAPGRPRMGRPAVRAGLPASLAAPHALPALDADLPALCVLIGGRSSICAARNASARRAGGGRGHGGYGLQRSVPLRVRQVGSGIPVCVQGSPCGAAAATMPKDAHATPPAPHLQQPCLLAVRARKGGGMVRLDPHAVSLCVLFCLCVPVRCPDSLSGSGCTEWRGGDSTYGQNLFDNLMFDSFLAADDI
jgi:hypothetical protein